MCVCAIVKWSERGKVKEGKREIKGMRERGEKERRERERESLIIGGVQTYSTSFHRLLSPINWISVCMRSFLFVSVM